MFAPIWVPFLGCKSESANGYLFPFWKIKDIKQNLEHTLCVEAHYSLIKFEIWKSIDKLIFVVNEKKIYEYKCLSDKSQTVLKLNHKKTQLFHQKCSPLSLPKIKRINVHHKSLSYASRQWYHHC